MSFSSSDKERRMATAPQAARTEPAGAGQAAPLDALHPHGRLRATARCRSSPAARAATSSTSTASATSTGSAALFCVNAGHGRTELGEAAARQVEELDFYTNWSYAHPRAIELADADRVAGARRPQPRLLHQRRLGGGRVGAEARPRLPPLNGKGQKHKVIAREIAYHGTTLGALSATGITRLRDALRAARRPAAATSPNTNTYRWPEDRDPLWAADADRAADHVRGPRDGRRRDPRAGPERRRLLPAAGGLLPARARDLRRATTCC